MNFIQNTALPQRFTAQDGGVKTSLGPVFLYDFIYMVGDRSIITPIVFKGRTLSDFAYIKPAFHSRDGTRLGSRPRHHTCVVSAFLVSLSAADTETHGIFTYF